MRPSALFHNPLVRSVLDFVYPPLCLACGEFYESIPDPNGGERPVCHSCDRRIDALRFDTIVCAGCGAVLSASRQCPECGPEFWPLFSFANYRPPLDDVVLQFKFRGITSPAAWIAPKLVAQFAEDLRALERITLVPIPLHPSREYYRGYNQAAIFAAEIGRLLDSPVVGDLLFRVKHRRPQSRIDHRNREANVRGVFAVDDTDHEIADIVLVDDVVTTGATIREAQRTLAAENYRVVAAISMAHGL